jgi:hypothetical protein
LIICVFWLLQEGAESDDWRAGAPVRVVRGYKAQKHSKFAPKEGFRYDGIYKVNYTPLNDDLDQGHLHPKLEVPGREASTLEKSCSNSLLISIRNI